MKQYLSVLAIAFSLVTQNTFAQSCTDVDYRSELGPTRNQEDSDWCFAYASADLLSQKTGRVISALDVGTTYYIGNVDHLGTRAPAAVQKYYQDNQTAIRDLMVEERNYTDIDGKVPRINKLSGGQEDGVLLMANTKGLCAEADLPSDGGFSATDRAFLSKLAKDAVTQPASCLGWSLETGVSSALNTPAGDCVNAQWLASIESRCHRISYDQPIIPEVTRAAFDLSNYRDLIKRGKLKPADVRAQMMGKLNDVLSSGRIAAIGYNVNILWGYKRTDEEGDHSSSVVARRNVNGTCQYLVRDSFGSDCSGYGKKFRGPDRCEAGHIWVTEDELAGTAQLYSVIAIK